MPVQTLGQHVAICREPLHLASERFRLSGTLERHDEVGGDARTRAGPAPHPRLARTTSLSAPTDAPQFVDQRTSGAAAGCRLGARGIVSARNASLEIADDRAKDARGEKAWPQRTGPILTLASADRLPSCQLISSLTASGRFVAANPAALAAYAAAPKACAPI